MMNKFAKTMSNTSYKLKQKAGMAEKTVDTTFEGTKTMLNDLIDNANNISKAFVKHAESLEGLQPSKQLNDGYKLTLPENTNVNIDMQELFHSLGVIASELTDKKKEVVTNLQKYISELQSMKEKVKKRDELSVSHDKHKGKLQAMTTKGSKDEDKLNKEKLKTNQYRDRLEGITREVVEGVQQLHDSQQQNLSPIFHMMIGLQMSFFERTASVYQSSAVTI